MTKQLPKRCKFFVACGKPPVQFVQHKFLGTIAVCDGCAKTNPFCETYIGNIQRKLQEGGAQ